MKKSILGIAMLALILIVGCKKKEDDTDTGERPAPTVPRVFTTYQDSTLVTTFFEYSPSWAIGSQYNSIGVFRTVYHYAANTVIADVYINGNLDTTKPRIIYYLNSQGHADRALYRKTSGALLQKVDYSYDASGYLTSERWYKPGDSIAFFGRNYTISGGNTTTIDDLTFDSLNAPVIQGTATLTYHTDKASSISNENYGMKFLGASAPNVVKSYTYSVNGVNTVSATYNYEMDGNGRIASRVAYNEKTPGTILRGDSVVFSYF